MIITKLRTIEIYHGAGNDSHTPSITDKMHDIEGFFTSKVGTFEIRCTDGVAVTSLNNLKVVGDTAIYVAIYHWDEDTQCWDGLSDN